MTHFLLCTRRGAAFFKKGSRESSWRGHMRSALAIITVLLGLLAIIATGCSSGSSTTGSTSSSSSNSGSEENEETGYKLSAVVENLSAAAASKLAALAVRNNAVSAYALGDLTDVNVTPSVYKLALVNFWLIDEDENEINILNPDEENPTYTEDNPLIIDFTSPGEAEELLSGDTITAGTYTGFKMQFLYIEMKFPVVFHLPDIAVESDYADVDDIKDVEITRSFRLYFNAIGKYWKRDFVIELDEGTDEWYWMRRELEDHDGYRNFFIAVADNDHPPGGAGPDNIIDLFADEEFWGPEDEYDSSENPIIVGTHSTAGGLSVSMDNEFTIPDTLEEFLNLDLMVDVIHTMNFKEEEGAAPAGVVFTDGVLDLGPGCGGEIYGDCGLHPMMPHFSLEAASGTMSSFVLVEPADESEDTSLTPTLTWADAENESSYTLQIATDADFQDIILEDDTIEADTTSFEVQDGTLSAGTTYYWTVQAVNGEETEVATNEPFSFTTQ
jgi:hypothetical protein